MDYLSYAIHLGAHESAGSWPNVAANTLHFGMRRHFIRGEFRLHYVARGPAKVRRLHVADTAIGKLAGDHDIKKGGYGDETCELAQLRISRINWLELGRQFTSVAHPAPAQINAKGDEEKTANKDSRQKQVDNDTHIGVNAAAAQRDGQKDQPGDGGSCNHHHTYQADQVVREENNG